MLKVLDTIFMGAVVIMIGYMMVSYADILANNLHSGELADWNIFKILMK